MAFLLNLNDLTNVTSQLNRTFKLFMSELHDRELDFFKSSHKKDRKGIK